MVRQHATDGKMEAPVVIATCKKQLSVADGSAKQEPSRSAAGAQSVDHPRLGPKLWHTYRQRRPPRENLDFRGFEDPDRALSS
jgi:hypothetical protein